MRAWTSLTAGVAAIALLATPLSAQSDADTGDAICVYALQTLSEQASGTDRAAFESAMMFHLGKLIGRRTAGDMDVLLDAIGQTVKPADLPEIATECVDEMSAATDQLLDS